MIKNQKITHKLKIFLDLDMQTILIGQNMELEIIEVGDVLVLEKLR